MEQIYNLEQKMTSSTVVGKVSPMKWTSKQCYIWSIDKTCFFEKNYKILWSPVIRINSDNQTTKWQMKILLKSSLANCKDFTSIYIYNRNNFCVTAQIHLCFLNNRNKRVESRDMCSHTFEPEAGFGYPSYVKRSWITDDNNDIIINGYHQIRCDIMVKNPYEIVDQINLNKSTLSEDFGYLLEEKEFSDVTLKTRDGKSFHLHKCILVARSPVFEAMFKSDMKESCQNEVDIEDFSYEVMDQLFRYIYTGKTSEMGNLAIDVLQAADKYEIKGLMDLCEKSLCDQITFGNVLEFLKVADMHNAVLLKDKTIQYISSHVDEIADLPDLEAFISLHPAVTCQIFAAIKSKCYF